MKEAVIKLMRVKTIITLVLTAVFAYLCCTGQIEAREFITVFTVVVSFYFGTQHERAEEVFIGTKGKKAADTQKDKTEASAVAVNTENKSE